MPLTWVLPGPISRRTFPGRGRRAGTSTTCTGRGARAGGCTSRRGRTGCRTRRCRSAPGCRRWRSTSVVFQHVPVERARQLIADLTGGIVSAGFVHSCLAKAAGLVKDACALIRTLIAASPVAGFDETTLRSGPAGEKKYVHGAFTELYSAFHLGTRGLETMREAGILPFFAGIVVSDRYAGLLQRDLGDVRRPPGLRSPSDQGLRGLRRDLSRLRVAAAGPAGAARARSAPGTPPASSRLPAIPAEVREPLELEFRRAVTFGLSAVPRVPGPKNSVKQKPGREMLEFCKSREADVLRFASDTSRVADEQHLRARRPPPENPAEESAAA